MRRGRHARGMVGGAVEAGCLSEGWGSAKETLRRLDTSGRGGLGVQLAWFRHGKKDHLAADKG
jgi:hypothetical protein